MIGRPLPIRTGEEAVRVVRALGAHRYVHGRLHSVHALVFDAAFVGHAGEPPETLTAACAWAAETLANDAIDPESKDPLLYRNAAPEELVAALQAFWVPGDIQDRAHDRLLETADELGMEVPLHDPFDERVEDDMHPILIDAGWELLPLASLDPTRHRGVIEAYAEPILYAAARFEEESAIPPLVSLQELPAMGLAELLRAVTAEGELAEELILWTQGDDVYHDYLLRGVLKAAKIADPR